MHDFASINWRSRGYLPHFDTAEKPQHVIFGLADALEEEFDEPDPVKRMWAFDEVLDRNVGSCVLGRSECAAIVQTELLHHDGRLYRLLAWCVMPNHVHVVLDGVSDLPGVVRRWKTWTSRSINAMTGRTGRLWRREYFDRFARTENHLGTMIHYVEANPVAAKLVASPEMWKWSSAGYR